MLVVAKWCSIFRTVTEVVTVKDDWSTEFFLQIAKDVLLMGVLKLHIYCTRISLAVSLSRFLIIFVAVSWYSVSVSDLTD